VLIEPCYGPGNNFNDSITRCPDIPIDYYRKNAVEVKGWNGTRDENIGFVSGVPNEYKITHLGKAYLFDEENTKNPNTNSANNATLLSNYPYRVLPISEDGYRTLLTTTMKSIITYYKMDFNYTHNKQNGAPAPTEKDKPIWLQRNPEALAPYPELTCPLEIIITDNRDPSKSFFLFFLITFY
jgi:hypothetical protein